MSDLNLHQFVMPNGRHKDVKLTRVPVSYLKWMVNVHHSFSDYAEAELQRRGTVTPELEISGHAIDRASLRCRRLWHETRSQEEGLHAWLIRKAVEARRQGREIRTEESVRIEYEGMRFIFSLDTVWPVLLSIMLVKER